MLCYESVNEIDLKFGITKYNWENQTNVKLFNHPLSSTTPSPIIIAHWTKYLWFQMEKKLHNPTNITLYLMVATESQNYLHKFTSIYMFI